MSTESNLSLATLILAVAVLILLGIQACPRATEEIPPYVPGGWQK
jgi:hypothetical protein